MDVFGWTSHNILRNKIVTNYILFPVSAFCMFLSNVLNLARWWARNFETRNYNDMLTNAVLDGHLFICLFPSSLFC
jgi:hypothetical protein